MSRFVVPDASQSTSDDSISYFQKRDTVKLDETKRNFGVISPLATGNKVPTPTDKSTKTEHKNDDETASNKASALELDDNSNQVENLNTGGTEVEAHPPTGGQGSSISTVFAFIKSTEFYNAEADLEKAKLAAAETRKRKLEEKEGGPTKKPPVGGIGRCLIISHRQHGNPLLSHLRNTPVTYCSDIIPDFVMGEGVCALFLSLKYHRLHPNYIYDRLQALGKGYRVRVLLVQVDTSDTSLYIQELSKIAILSSLTLLLAWSPVEAARYLEAFKIYENKPAEVLQGIKDTTFSGYTNNFLTSIRGVNKFDVARLKGKYETMKEIVSSDKAQLSSIPGIGAKKASRIHDAFRQPFKWR